MHRLIIFKKKIGRSEWEIYRNVNGSHTTLSPSKWSTEASTNLSCPWKKNSEIIQFKFNSFNFFVLIYGRGYAPQHLKMTFAYKKKLTFVCLFYCIAHQHPAKNASTQRPGQPAHLREGYLRKKGKK